MPSPGVIAITPDKTLGKTLRVALTAAGADARAIASFEDLPKGSIDASLVVLHLADADNDAVARVAKQLKNGSQLIVLLPRGDLAATVAALQSHEGVAGVLNADRIRPQEVTAMATRLLFGDIFGLDKVLPWGARIHSLQVGTYDEKSAAIDQISSFAASIGIRRKYRENIEQCCDEMLMNALYDAPVDADGKPLADRPGRNRPALEGDDKAVIEYGFDGQRFAVAVRDRFGRFERSMLIRYLDKCLHSHQQMDRKPGGAGLGLYLISNSATSLMFNLLPGVATECVCTFDVGASKLELEHLGVFKERVDSQGRLLDAKGNSAPFPLERRRRPSGTPAPLASPDAGSAPASALQAGQTVVGRGFTVMLGLAVILLIAAIGVVGYSRLGNKRSDRALAASGPTQPHLDLGKNSDQRAVLPPANTVPLTIRSSVPGFVTVQGREDCDGMSLPLARCYLPDGTHHVHVYGDDPMLDISFTVNISGQPVDRDLELGVIEARPGYSVAVDRRQPPTRRIAVQAGDREVLVIDETTGAIETISVPVRQQQSLRVP